MSESSTTEKLVLEVATKGARGVDRELDNLDKDVRRVEKSTLGLKGSFIAFFGVLTAGAAALTGVTTKLIQSAKSSQNAAVQLEVATGSVENAAEAMLALEKFASTTPFSLAQATEAYIKLANLGLTPSERALRSYGNTATSMSKDLNQMIEAVADAATGEFERLKEFGIKASKEGDQITFTFRGVKTQVENTGAAIENFLIALGEKNFGSAMSKGMLTIGGQLSNLGDEWDKLFVLIGRQGAADVFGGVFKKAISALTEVNAMLSSGELRAKVVAYGYLWSGVADSITTSFKLVTGSVTSGIKEWSSLFNISQQEITEYFRYFPLVAEAAVGHVTNYFIELFRRIGASLSDFVDSFAVRFEQLQDVAGAAGEAIYDALFGSGDYDFQSELHRISDVGDARVAAIEAETELKKTRAQEFHDQERARIVAEYDLRVESFEKAYSEAALLRERYDAEQETRRQNNADALARLAPTPVSGGENFGGQDKAMLGMLQDVAKGLEGDTSRQLVASWQNTLDVITESTQSSQEQRKATSLRFLERSLMTEANIIRQAYDFRFEFIKTATELAEEEKTRLMEKLTTAREQSLTKIELDSQKERLGQANDFFGNLASIGSTFGKKGFEIAKAASIAQATIKTYESATGAYASLSGIPYIGPVLGAAAAAAAIAAGAANIAAIKSQQYTPAAYATGGMIPAGRVGIVGEAGPELVQGPSIVTGAASSAGRLGQNSRALNVTINNQGAPAEAEVTQDGDNLLVLLRPMLAKQKEEIHRELTAEVQRGGGRFSRAVEGTYKLRR